MITIERTMNRRSLLEVETLPVMLFEGERFAHKFIITPDTEDGFSGYSVTGRMMLSDGQNVAVEGWIDADGKACAVLTPACYAVPGRYQWSLFAVSDVETICVYSCRGMISPTLGRKGAAAEPTEPIVEAYTDPAIAELREQIAALQEAVAAIRPSPFLAGDVDGTAVLGDENSFANVPYSLAVGEGAEATGPDSFAIGHGAEANGDHSAAFGQDSEANGLNSVAMGKGTIAKKRSQLVIGEYNEQDPSNTTWEKRGTYALIVGNGSDASGTIRRSNAMALDWGGILYLNSALVLGTGSNQTMLTSANLKKLLALLT